MTNCKYIDKRGICRLKGCYAANHKCFGEDMCRCVEPMTNADRIRTMSDEELAEFLESSHGCPSDDDCEYGRYAKIENCIKHWENWLRQPAEGGTVWN